MKERSRWGSRWRGQAGRRVILGSANLSQAAFSGRQGEHVVVFDDDPPMYVAALRIYEEQLLLAAWAARSARTAAVGPPSSQKQEGLR